MDFVELWAKWYDTRIRFKAKLIVSLKNGPTALHKTTWLPCFKFSATSNGTEIVSYLYLYVYFWCGLRMILGTIHGTNWKYTLITRRICIVWKGSPLARTPSWLNFGQGQGEQTTKTRRTHWWMLAYSWQILHYWRMVLSGEYLRTWILMD